MHRLCLSAIVALAVSLAMLCWASDELTLTQGWQYNKDGRTRTVGSTATRFDVSGNGVVENVQSIPTNIVAVDLILGSVTTAGYAWFKNLGPAGTLATNMVQTNSIEIGRLDTWTNFCPFFKINTNEAVMVWLSTTNVRARALGTNNVRLDYVIVDK